MIFYGTFAKFTEQILCRFRSCYIFMDCIKNFNFKFYIVLSMSISDFEINKLLGCFHLFIFHFFTLHIYFALISLFLFRFAFFIRCFIRPFVSSKVEEILKFSVS